MRKNKMMRTASGLLVATLLTTSVIAGTFAKYTTEATGSDAARVAKWGVTALVSGDLFGDDYGAKTENGGNEISANYTGSVDNHTENGSVAKGDSKIVAPGTQNSTGVTISISGTPEVANKVTFTNTTNDNKDIYLKAGTYGTMVKATGVTEDNFDEKTYYTESNGTYSKAETYSADTTAYYVLQDKVDVTGNGYYPITWTVTDNTKAVSNTETFTNVGAMASKLNEDLSSSTDANNKSLEKIDQSYTITWEWAFDNTTVTNADAADTILGNLIAKDKNAVAVKKGNDDSYAEPTENDYSVNVAFNYSIKVEQVD